MGNRRELLILLGGAVIAPRGLRAQQKAMPALTRSGTVWLRVSPGRAAT